MKAFLLAGGRGERLRPLTLACPKCLVPIDGVPLLDIWLRLCEREGVTDVLLNVSHHVALVERFLAQASHAVRVRLVAEAQPRGTAATVAAHRDFVGDDESFWIFYADNLTDLQLTPMQALHAAHDDLLTMGVFHTATPHAAGIVEVQPNGVVTGFVEKPAHPTGTLANAGIYLARRTLFDVIPARDGIVDFGHDVLPALVGRMRAYAIPELLMDIGTPESLARAEAVWAARRAGEPAGVS